MAQFYDCWHNRHTTTDLLQRLLDEAQANRQQEDLAAIRIQRLFRGQLVRGRVTCQRRAALEIERVFRGHCARKRTTQLRLQRTRLQKRAFLNCFAITIQRMVRGHQSRRLKLDFRVRKAYMTEIATKGETMREFLNQKLQEQQQLDHQQHEQAKAQEFTEITQQLHHLVSTRAIPGVFNAVMQPAVTTCFGQALEQQIRTNSMQLVTQTLHQQLAENPPTRLMPYPPSNKQSIQASSPFESHLRAVRTHKKYQKLRNIAPKDFQNVVQPASSQIPLGQTACRLRVKHAQTRASNTGAVNSRNHQVHLHQQRQEEPVDTTCSGFLNDGVEYLDTWNNPYFKRGIPQSKRDLLPQLSQLGHAPSKPFYVATGGNKSKVYANNRFDI